MSRRLLEGNHVTRSAMQRRVHLYQAAMAGEDTVVSCIHKYQLAYRTAPMQNGMCEDLFRLPRWLNNSNIALGHNNRTQHSPAAVLVAGGTDQEAFRRCYVPGYSMQCEAC